MKEINIDMLIADLNRVRDTGPLVHNITNYVVMNNTANALLAIGASPVMAHSVDEVEDMVSIAGSLVINIGTLEKRWVRAMIMAGKKARKRGIPVILDPVGSGATPYRTEASLRIIAECRPSIIRGNASEIASLLDSDVSSKGVDSSMSSADVLAPARELSIKTGAVVSVSGAEDYITDGSECFIVRNGSPLMTRVTGLGCTASAVTGAFAAVNPDTLSAAAGAMSLMGIAGERASLRSEGTGSMQVNFLDELSLLNAERIAETLRTSNA